MKTIESFIAFAFLTLVAGAAFAANQNLSGMMDECDMMSGGFMLASSALLVLLFIALILAIMSLAKYLFFKKS